MRLAVVASTLILVTASAWSSALAQGAPSREAPVGHRQPKAGEVPQAQELTDAEKRQNAAASVLGQDVSRVHSDGSGSGSLSSSSLPR